MSDSKKYYYLKVKETFFDGEEMKVLESMQNGILYQNFYLKLCLLSVKSGGALLFKNTIPYDMTMIATVLRVSVDTVKTGIEIFQKLQLVDILDNGVIYMSDIQTLIGQSSTEAERVKLYRERLCTNVRQTYEKCTPELELEQETDKSAHARDETPEEISPELASLLSDLEARNHVGAGGRA
jgi:predicted phage replisome organizer